MVCSNTLVPSVALWWTQINVEVICENSSDIAVYRIRILRFIDYHFTNRYVNILSKYYAFETSIYTVVNLSPGQSYYWIHWSWHETSQLVALFNSSHPYNSFTVSNPSVFNVHIIFTNSLYFDPETGRVVFCIAEFVFYSPSVIVLNALMRNIFLRAFI